MKKLKFSCWYSAEDECWLARAEGFPNGQTVMAHGDGPGGAVTECGVAAALVLCELLTR